MGKDDIPHGAIRRAVAAILLSKGRTIRDMEDSRGSTFPGDGLQDAYKDSPVWHGKRELDYMVARRLELDVDALLGPKRVSSDFSRYITSITYDLRRRGTIQDWNGGRQFGIWRLADPSGLAKYLRGTTRATAPPAEPADPNLNHAFLSILSHGRKDNTYKFALARALLDYCRENPDASDDALTIPYSYFADKFMRYYFYQEYKFRIRQNFRAGTPPRAIKILRETFGAGAPGDFDLLDRDTIEKVRRRFLANIFGHARNKTSLVIPRFQRVPRGSSVYDIRAFYDYDDEAQVITVKPRAFDFFRRNHAILTKAVLMEWAKFLERINPSLPMLVAKIERDEARRGSLAPYKKLYLKHWSHCFYCRGRLEWDYTHVDHLIPWSYLFDDNAWNLVLACQECNCRKSNSLPQEEFRGSLIHRNDKYYSLMPKMKKSLDLLDAGRGWKLEITEQYERCLEYGFGVTRMP